MSDVPAEEERAPVLVFNAIRNPQKRGFLAAFAATGNYTRAAKLAGVHITTHYVWKKRDPVYVEAFETALEMAGNRFEDLVRERAFEGRDKPLVFQGVISKDEDGNTVTVKEYSDLLAMFSLKGLFPERYRDNAQINIDNRKLTFNVDKADFNFEKYKGMLTNGIDGHK